MIGIKISLTRSVGSKMLGLIQSAYCINDILKVIFFLFLNFLLSVFFLEDYEFMYNVLITQIVAKSPNFIFLVFFFCVR